MNTFGLDKNYDQFDFEQITVDDLAIISGGSGGASCSPIGSAEGAAHAAMAGAAVGATLGVPGAIFGAAWGAAWYAIGSAIICSG